MDQRNCVCADQHDAVRLTATSAPGLSQICTGTKPHLHRDQATSAPGPSHICTATCCRYVSAFRHAEVNGLLLWDLAGKCG